jgi:hypothetical protein
MLAMLIAHRLTCLHVSAMLVWRRSACYLALLHAAAPAAVDAQQVGQNCTAGEERGHVTHHVATDKLHTWYSTCNVLKAGGQLNTTVELPEGRAASYI